MVRLVIWDAIAPIMTSLWWCISGPAISPCDAATERIFQGNDRITMTTLDGVVMVLIVYLGYKMTIWWQIIIRSWNSWLRVVSWSVYLLYPISSEVLRSKFGAKAIWTGGRLFHAGFIGSVIPHSGDNWMVGSITRKSKLPTDTCTLGSG